MKAPEKMPVAGVTLRVVAAGLFEGRMILPEASMPREMEGLVWEAVRPASANWSWAFRERRGYV